MVDKVDLLGFTAIVVNIAAFVLEPHGVLWVCNGVLAIVCTMMLVGRMK